MLPAIQMPILYFIELSFHILDNVLLGTINLQPEKIRP